MMKEIRYLDEIPLFRPVPSRVPIEFSFKNIYLLGQNVHGNRMNCQLRVETAGYAAKLRFRQSFSSVKR